MPHRVAVLLIEPVVGFDSTIPSMIFGSAKDGDGKRRPLYDVRVCGLTRDPVRSSHGFSITPDHGPEAIDDADTVIIPGTYHDEPVYRGSLPAPVAAALRRIRPGTRVMSICTGAFVLGAAGLLDGRRATTHWAHADRFRELYPAVDLDPDTLFTDDGTILTSAGVAAGIDLCLHVIRADFGTEVANGAARRCVVPAVRAGGQAQFIQRHLPAVGSDGTTATRDWALGRLDQRLDVAALARHARMSTRTFNRHFIAETGVTPARWLADERLSYARELLETTDLTVEQIATRSGLGTGATLRQHMRATLGVAPLTYRRTFRAPTA